MEKFDDASRLKQFMKTHAKLPTGDSCQNENKQFAVICTHINIPEAGLYFQL